ncbi:HAMP domain-containing histidine kinase [Streptomyces californicus]
MKLPAATAAFGVRTRLVLAFLLVAAVSAVTTAALTYREARNAVLERAQDTAVASFREEAERFVPRLPLDRAAPARCGARPRDVLAEYARSASPRAGGFSPAARTVTGRRRRCGV